jgi:hypothetical protein
METKKTVLWAMAFALISGNRLLADPYMTSLQVGAQAPDPVSPGGSATYSITITKTNSGGVVINLSTLGLPAGATASFSPNPVSISKSATVGMATLTISTTNALQPTYYPFQVVGQDGGSHNTLTNNAALDMGIRPACLERMPDGCFCYTFGSIPGKTYLVQANTNLCCATWTTLCSTNAGTNSLMMYIDTDRTFYSCRFYRTVMQ